MKVRNRLETIVRRLEEDLASLDELYNVLRDICGEGEGEHIRASVLKARSYLEEASRLLSNVVKSLDEVPKMPEWLSEFIDKVKKKYGVEPVKVFYADSLLEGDIRDVWVVIYDFDWKTWGKVAKEKPKEYASRIFVLSRRR